MIRYKPKQYAAALLEALRSEPKREDRIIKNFVRVLSEHKDFSKWRRIEGLFEKAYHIKGKEKHIEVMVARTDNALEQRIRKAMPSKSKVVFRVDPSLIGGVRILVNNEILIDGSVNRRIQKLFKS